MAGHNKWTQIKRQKGKEDAKRAKLFSMYSRQITIEAKKALGDNPEPEAIQDLFWAVVLLPEFQIIY